MNVDIEYALLMTKRMETDLKFLKKQEKPLDVDNNSEHRDSFTQVRTCINHLDEMFQEFNF